MVEKQPDFRIVKVWKNEIPDQKWPLSSNTKFKIPFYKDKGGVEKKATHLKRYNGSISFFFAPVYRGNFPKRGKSKMTGIPESAVEVSFPDFAKRTTGFDYGKPVWWDKEDKPLIMKQRLSRTGPMSSFKQYDFGPSIVQGFIAKNHWR